MAPESNDADATAIYAGGRDGGGAPDGPVEISGYRIERRLGEGGMGAVYLAEEIALGRRVAIKVVSDRIARNAEARARFLREARLLATVEHPNVVRVYTFGVAEDRPYLVMEYVEGETLAERIRRDGAIPLDAALDIVRHIIDALAGAWEKRVIHRDIKPSNILFDARGRLRVADFGLAKGIDATSTDSSLTQTGYLLGSPHYVAPEQAQGHESDFRSDIYSLGIMLYEMLAARKPFEAASALAIVAKHLHETLPPVRAIRGELPASVDELIGWMTEKDPVRRPASYAELAAALPGDTTREITAPRVGPPKRGRPLLAWTLLLAALALGGMLAWRRLGGDGARAAAGTRGRMVIAVTPFYGPDHESAREGRMMASLAEREIARRMRDEVRVVGVEDTKMPVRDSDAARELGEKLGASLVIWGDAYVFRGEAEIQPSITVVPHKRSGAARATQGADPISELMAVQAMRVATEAPNQIELRKTSAEGIGDLAVFAVATHLMHDENDAPHALELLSELRPTADALQQKARALLQMGREGAAIAELRKALELDSGHAGVRGALSDIAIRAGRYGEAAEHLRAVRPGQRLTTTEGLFYNDQLFVVEQYAERDRHFRAPTLLVIDPASGRVRERFWLPGVPAALSVEQNALAIRYRSGFHEPHMGTVRFADGRFTPPRHLPDELLTRVHGTKAGWIYARDFLYDVATPQSLDTRRPVFRYKPFGQPRENGPTTVAALRAELEQAIVRDPTQPWFVLQLALAQWELGDRAAANANAQKALSGGYPGTPYYEYSWMARHLESYGHRDWADLAYGQALKRRRESPPTVSSSMLLERFINTPFTRGVAALSRWTPDPLRHFEWLERTRTLGGAVYEGDRAVALLWQRYFEDQGNHVLAQRAERLVRESRGFDITKWTAIADLAFPAILSIGAVLVVLLIVAIARGKRRSFSWRPRAIAAGVPRGMRVAVIVLLIAEVLLLFVQMRAFRAIELAIRMPAGLADTLGTPANIDALEARLAESFSEPMAFAAATANHLAGHARRAAEQYERVTVDRRARENLSALQRRQPPQHVPTGAEVRQALMSMPLSGTLADLGLAMRPGALPTSRNVDWERRVRFNATAIVALLAMMLLLAAWFASSRPDDSFTSWTPLRVALAAAAILFLALGWIVHRVASEGSMEGMPTAGVLTAEHQPAYGTAYPLPPFKSFEAAKRAAAVAALPMRIFYWTMGLVALLALALLAPGLRQLARSRIRRPIWYRKGASSV